MQHKKNTETKTKLEKRLTESDIKKIKSNRDDTYAISLLFFVALGVLIYFINNLSSSEKMPRVIIYFLFAVVGYAVFKTFFYNKSNKDLNSNLKIITTVIVKSKEIERLSSSTDLSRSNLKYYVLKFEGEPDIKRYKVKEHHFEKINIGDVIDIEYVKESLYILKIELNSENIEHRSYTV